MTTVKIEKLVFGGQALARMENKVALVWNALPGEEVEIEIYRKQKSFVEAIATKIITPSPIRVEPSEPHYLCCSPWQILPFADENYWKEQIALETYQKIGRITPVDELKILSDASLQYGYRNKMEYSFTTNAEGKLSLAFFKRGTHRYEAIEPCTLAQPQMNVVAKQILAWVESNNIPLRSLKTMLLRSNRKGEVIAALFIKDELPFTVYPELNSTLKGFSLFLSNFRCPASVIDKVLYTTGQNHLVESLRGIDMKIGLMSFFQINPSLFETAVEEMANWVETGSKLVDYYSGVGSIGIPMQKNAASCELVDISEESVAFANENIISSGLQDRYTAKAIPAEKLTGVIAHDKTIVLDPPRAGLHDKVVAQLLAEKPVRIIYMSCNISTHARDLAALQTCYTIRTMKLYNFFPKTPHFEGLCVLDRNA